MSSRIVFQADTQQFNDPVQRSANEVRALQAELRKMESTAKQSFQEQRLAARAAGASTEDLRKLDQAYAREQIALNSTRKQINAESIAGSREQVSAEEAKARAIELTTKALERQRAAAAAIPQARSQHYEPSERQQASAIVRGAGGTLSIRAGESALTQIPGFANVAGPLFAAAGVAALTTDIARGIEKIIELRKEASETGKALREAFEDGFGAARVHSVDLDLVNDRLDQQIAKLSHTPYNGLKIALDEDRKAAAELSQELTQTARLEKDVLEKHGVSEFQALGYALVGKNVASTDEQKAFLLGSNANVRRASNSAQDALDNASPADAEAVRQKNREILLGTVNAEIQKTQSALNAVYANQAVGKGVDFSGQTEVLEEHLDGLKRQAHDLKAGFDATTKDRQRQTIEEAKQRAADAREAARIGLEASKQAAEAQRKQWEDDLGKEEEYGKLDAEHLALFWANRENVTKKGSDNYIFAEMKVNENIRKANEDREKILSEGLKMQREFGAMGLAALNGGALERTGNAYAKGQGEAAKSGSDLRDQQEDAARTIALSNVQLALQNGQISKNDAAVQVATIHQMQYEAQMQRLRDQRAAIQDGPNADAERNENAQQQAKLMADYQVQAMQDGANVAATTWLGALKRTNALWVQDSQDSAKQIAQLYGTIMDGVNNDLTNVLQHVGERGYHHNGRDLRNALAGTARGAGGELMNAGLRRAEGGLMTALGIGGKADGSRQNPLNVFVINGIDGKTEGSLLPSSASIRNVMPGGSDSSGFTNSFAGAALSFLPGGSLLSGLFGGKRALGGGVQAGKSYIVGDGGGPELFTPEVTGNITPADRTRSMLGGHTINVGDIDARGAHDPAAVRAQVKQGILEAAPHIIAASQAFGKDQRSRVPTSMRG